jgi:hypothetical protein
MNPTIPDATNLSPGVAHNITVYGTNLWSWMISGQLYFTITDDKNPGTVHWGSFTNAGPVPGNPNAWTYSAIETGSSPGSSTISITVSLFPTGQCRGSWGGLPVTYV